jgi:hypothetical protein
MKPSSNRRPPKGKRPHLTPISEEMKAWSTALAAELTSWPHVSSRPMFGFIALYRGKRIFAILPRTRGMGSANSLAFKLENPGPRPLAQLQADKRLSTTVMRATRWFVFELTWNRDLNDALDWLGRAYDAAR